MQQCVLLADYPDLRQSQGRSVSLNGKTTTSKFWVIWMLGCDAVSHKKILLCRVVLCNHLVLQISTIYIVKFEVRNRIYIVASEALRPSEEVAIHSLGIYRYIAVVEEKTETKQPRRNAMWLVKRVQKTRDTSGCVLVDFRLGFAKSYPDSPSRFMALGLWLGLPVWAAWGNQDATGFRMTFCAFWLKFVDVVGAAKLPPTYRRQHRRPREDANGLTKAVHHPRHLRWTTVSLIPYLLVCRPTRTILQGGHCGPDDTAGAISGLVNQAATAYSNTFIAVSASGGLNTATSVDFVVCRLPGWRKSRGAPS
jgi:hypothetical protein